MINKKYEYDDNFFKTIDTEEKAYWLGFLYADGCVSEVRKKSKIKSYILSMNLAVKDKPHLNKFINSIKSNIPIKENIVKLNGKEYKAVRINLCSTQICKDLINKKCVPRKSLILEYPSNNIVPENLIKHFIRGYFDGDGCIYFDKNKPQSGAKIIIVGTLDMINGICKEIYDNNININPAITTKGNAYQLYIYNLDNIIKIYDYFYKNSTIFLDRKYEYYTKYLNVAKQNRRTKTNKIGVYFHKKSKKYTTSITINKERKHLGYFKTLEEAVEVRNNAEREKFKNRLAEQNRNVLERNCGIKREP